uniref:Uncharacterized protein n=1 Tax=Plectus sambesii TaxID=2011161 RepID=A0A914XFQ0_9BILA
MSDHDAIQNKNVDVVWKKSASVPRAIDSRDFRYGLTRIGKRLSKSSRATNLRDFRNGLTRIGKRYYIIPANSWDY